MTSEMKWEISSPRLNEECMRRAEEGGIENLSEDGNRFIYFKNEELHHLPNILAPIQIEDIGDCLEISLLRIPSFEL